MPETMIYKDGSGLVVHADGQPDYHCWGHEYTVQFAVGGGRLQGLTFQNGPIAAYGVNGLTNEAVLAILIHRIGVLNEKLPCEQNELVLGNLRTALALLEDRTADRVARGVEGKETV